MFSLTKSFLFLLRDTYFIDYKLKYHSIYFHTTSLNMYIFVLFCIHQTKSLFIFACLAYKLPEHDFAP